MPHRVVVVVAVRCEIEYRKRVRRHFKTGHGRSKSSSARLRNVHDRRGIKLQLMYTRDIESPDVTVKLDSCVEPAAELFATRDLRAGREMHRLRDDKKEIIEIRRSSARRAGVRARATQMRTLRIIAFSPAINETFLLKRDILLACVFPPSLPVLQDYLVSAIIDRNVSVISSRYNFQIFNLYDEYGSNAIFYLFRMSLNALFSALRDLFLNFAIIRNIIIRTSYTV